MNGEIKADLKRLIADPSTHGWEWDECNWRWEICLADVHTLSDPDLAWEDGYAAIEAVIDGKPLDYGTYPPADHTEWVVEFVVTDGPTFAVKGSLSEAKRQLDNLLGADTPAIPKERL
jgi:hypothetical protein